MSDDSSNTLIALSRKLRTVPAKDLPLVPRAVLLFLAARANEDGIAWPRLETLAADAGTSTNTVRRALDWLIAAGWVWVRQPGTPRDSARLEVRLEPAPPPSGPVERYQGSRSVSPGVNLRDLTQRHPRDHAPSSEGSRSVVRGITERGARDHAPSPEDPREDHKEDHREDPRAREEGSSDRKNRSLEAALETPIPGSTVRALEGAKGAPTDGEALKLEPTGEPPKKRRRPETPIPTGWGPSEEHFKLGRSLGFDAQRVKREGDRFADGARAKDRRYVDWHAAFANWLRNEQKFAEQRGERLAPIVIAPETPKPRSTFVYKPRFPGLFDKPAETPKPPPEPEDDEPEITPEQRAELIAKRRATLAELDAEEAARG